MRVVVVTGGIGSGKSVACRYLCEKYGWPVYNADERVKHLYQSHPSVLSDIESRLGLSLRNEAGQFVSSRLSSVIFKDRNALEEVENIVFPALSEDFRCWKNENSTSSVVVLESATILEKEQLQGIADLVVLIDAPFYVRLHRASKRDCVNSELVLDRMRNQMLMNRISDGIATAPADHVITNDGDMEFLFNSLDELVKKVV